MRLRRPGSVWRWLKCCAVYGYRASVTVACDPDQRCSTSERCAASGAGDDQIGLGGPLRGARDVQTAGERPRRAISGAVPSKHSRRTAVRLQVVCGIISMISESTRETNRQSGRRANATRFRSCSASSDGAQDCEERSRARSSRARADLLAQFGSVRLLLESVSTSVRRLSELSNRSTVSSRERRSGSLETVSTRTDWSRLEFSSRDTRVSTQSRAARARLPLLASKGSGRRPRNQLLFPQSSCYHHRGPTLSIAAPSGFP